MRRRQSASRQLVKISYQTRATTWFRRGEAVPEVDVSALDTFFVKFGPAAKKELLEQLEDVRNYIIKFFNSSPVRRQLESSRIKTKKKVR